MAVRVKTQEEIETLRQGGKRLAAVLASIAAEARAGVATLALDMLAERLIREHGGAPIFKGYRIKEAKTPFPAAVCVSVNDEIVHGIPRPDRILHDGDIVGIDIGMRWNRMVTDAAVTIGVGRISSEAERLIRVTREALVLGIAAARPGATIGDIGYAIGGHLRKNRLGVIRDLAGHGVGYELHEPPLIPNYGKPGTGLMLREGMVIAIEPMATLGGWRITLDDDEWTFRTADRSLAAHFEHTIAMTENRAEVLTA